MSTMQGGSETTLQDRIIYDEEIADLIHGAVMDLGPLVQEGASLASMRTVLEGLVYHAIKEWTGE